MSIRVRCPGCQKSINAAEKYAGRTVQCPGCKTKLTIPVENVTLAKQNANPVVPQTKAKQPSVENRSVKTAGAFQISVPLKSGLDDTRPDYDSMISRLAGSSGASNPGRIPLNPIRYSLSRPLWPALLALACCVGIGLAVQQVASGTIKASAMSSPSEGQPVNFMDRVANRIGDRASLPRNGFQGAAQPTTQKSGKLAKSEKKASGRLAMLILFPAGATFIYFYDRLRHFMRGDANPGIVLTVNPTLIAVATDMSRNDDPYKAVKVFQTNLKLSTGSTLEVGSVIGTIAQYSASAGNHGHFADFNPVPAELATKNEDYLSSLIDSFDQEQYRQAAQAIKHLPQPYRPGLFHIGPEGTAEEMPKGLFGRLQSLLKRK